MKVHHINWLSKEACEAEVTISDGIYFCIAFSQPCEVHVGQDLAEPLHVFSANNIMLSKGKSVGIWLNNKLSLGCYVVGVLVDRANQIVCVGDIKLFVEEILPGGILEKDIIEFECARIDLW